MKKLFLTTLALCCVAFVSCGKKGAESQAESKSEMQTKVEEFATVRLSANLDKLSAKEKELVGVFLDIAQIMDDL